MIDLKMAEALKRFLESSACKNDCDPEDMTCDTNFARDTLVRFCEEKMLRLSELEMEKREIEARLGEIRNEKEEILEFLNDLSCKKCRGFKIGGQGIRICTCDR